jgi:hypothetical protein
MRWGWTVRQGPQQPVHPPAAGRPPKRAVRRPGQQERAGVGQPARGVPRRPASRAVREDVRLPGRPRARVPRRVGPQPREAQHAVRQAAERQRKRAAAEKSGEDGPIGLFVELAPVGWGCACASIGAFRLEGTDSTKAHPRGAGCFRRRYCIGAPATGEPLSGIVAERVAECW